MTNYETRIVTVFGSGRCADGLRDYQTAYDLGRLLAQAGFAVCNGGYGGTMEATARGAKYAGGPTIGIVAEIFGAEANKYIDRKIVVKTHHERLLRLVYETDAYVVLPGGTGTLVELALVWEYVAKGLIARKPIVVLGKAWERVVDIMKHELAKEGRTEAAGLVSAAGSTEECVGLIQRGLRT